MRGEGHGADRRGNLELEHEARERKSQFDGKKLLPFGTHILK